MCTHTTLFQAHAPPLGDVGPPALPTCPASFSPASCRSEQGLTNPGTSHRGGSQHCWVPQPSAGMCRPSWLQAGMLLGQPTAVAMSILTPSIFSFFSPRCCKLSCLYYTSFQAISFFLLVFFGHFLFFVFSSWMSPGNPLNTIQSSW